MNTRFPSGHSVASAVLAVTCALAACGDSGTEPDTPLLEAMVGAWVADVSGATLEFVVEPPLYECGFILCADANVRFDGLEWPMVCSATIVPFNVPCGTTVEARDGPGICLNSTGIDVQGESSVSESAMTATLSGSVLGPGEDGCGEPLVDWPNGTVTFTRVGS